MKKKLLQIDEENWFQDLWNDKNNANGNKLRTYRMFKKDLTPEPYLHMYELLYREEDDAIKVAMSALHYK